MEDLDPSYDIRFYIHDEEHIVKIETITPQTTLNYYLRNMVHLTGTKSMCLEGGCGACVVCVQFADPISKEVVTLAVNSCLVSLLSCHGWKIYTVESIGNSKLGYHPVQQALALLNGTQCGFCSPGMVMNMYALFQKENLTMKEVENSFGGNICRCTGYRPILTAFKSLCKDADKDLLKIPDIEDVLQCGFRKSTCKKKCLTPCRDGDEPLFFNLGDQYWIKVFDFYNLMAILALNIDIPYMLVAGNTAKGVYHTSTEDIKVFIDVTDVPDLITHSIQEDALVLGANMTLTKTIGLFYKMSNDPKYLYLGKMADHIDLVAHVPVRNVGTLAGNLMLKHKYNKFPSDIFLILEAAGAKLTIVDTNWETETLSPNEFLSTDMKGKVIKNITLLARDSSSFKYESYKIMMRAQNAHAMLNAAFVIQLDADDVVSEATIVYGAINPNFVHAKETEQYLIGKQLFDNGTLQGAFKKLDDELKPEDDPPEPKPEFREQLAIALFYKYVLSIAPANILTSAYKSGGTKLERPISSGSQEYSTNPSVYPVSEPIIKIEAMAQTSGEAEYLYDIPDHPHQLFAAFVLANAKPLSIITKVDPSKALEMDGVVAFYDKNDIPGRNTFTPIGIFLNHIEEELFCNGVVLFHSQPIGIVVAKTQELAEKAAEMVEVLYLFGKEKPMYSIREVLKADAKDRMVNLKQIVPTAKGKNVKHLIKGSMDIKWQYHYSMETQYCSVIPTEDGFDVYPSTQYMDLNQYAASVLLDIPANKINIRVRRLGGSYGAKLTRNSQISCAAILAAYKLNKPVKLLMPLTANMKAIGKRYPCSCDYVVAVNDDGTIQYLINTFYSDNGINGGNDTPLFLILDSFGSGYNKDTWAVLPIVIRTDTHANTWCRGPGTTEALAMTETIMEHIGYAINKDPLEVRIANVNQKKHPKLLTFINEHKDWADIDKRKAEIKEFNERNRWRKKGISVVPMSYVFTPFGNWTVIVSIYHMDGTVSVAHGGIEMGQGINTKVAQTCAYAFGIPIEMVSVKPSNNLTSPNSMFTGNSMTSEAVCLGVIKACEILLERMKPIRKKMRDFKWIDLIKLLYEQRVDLTATFMYSTKLPKQDGYTIYGVCAAEVEVDILTGLHQVTRVDLLEDTGDSLSPKIDIGQVEGAFVMGLGYYTTEEVVFGENGEILTNRTWNYKPPGAKDIPIDFRVKFPKNNPNPVGVLNSKATGEPALNMAIVVPFAIRNAVASARMDADKSKFPWYPIDGPSTVENTFMNSLNDYKEYVL